MNSFDREPLAIKIAYWIIFCILSLSILVILTCMLADAGITNSDNYFIEGIKSIWDFLNQNFFTALAGAFAGAYGAHFIAKNSQIHRELIAEIRDTNRAIVMSFNICNSMLALKNQHVHEIVTNYFDDRKKAADIYQRNLAGMESTGDPLHCSLDFKLLTPMDLAPDMLERQIFEKLSISGRPLRLVYELKQYVHFLNEAISQRNEMISSYREIISPGDNTPFLLFKYFGFKGERDSVDEEYRDVVEAIGEYTDNLIIFSAMICKDLEEYGANLKEKL